MKTGTKADNSRAVSNKSPASRTSNLVVRAASKAGPARVANRADNRVASRADNPISADQTTIRSD